MTNPSDAIPRYYVNETLIDERGPLFAVIDSKTGAAFATHQNREAAQWECYLYNASESMADWQPETMFGYRDYDSLFTTPGGGRLR